MPKTKEQPPAGILSQSTQNLPGTSPKAWGHGDMGTRRAWLQHFRKDTGPCGPRSSGACSAEENGVPSLLEHRAGKCETLLASPPPGERTLLGRQTTCPLSEA